MEQYFHWIDLLGIAVFAISGTLAAWRNQMDGFGVIVLASVTAIGGGTLRDLILDVPVIWINNNSYFYAIFIAVVARGRRWSEYSKEATLHWRIVIHEYDLQQKDENE